jgi:hypothetical protein
MTVADEKSWSQTATHARAGSKRLRTIKSKEDVDDRELEREKMGCEEEAEPMPVDEDISRMIM